MQRSSCGDARSAPEIARRRAGRREGIERDVDAVELAKILAAVLQVIVDLQRGAQRVVRAQVARLSPWTSSTKRPTGIAE